MGGGREAVGTVGGAVFLPRVERVREAMGKELGKYSGSRECLYMRNDSEDVGAPTRFGRPEAFFEYHDGGLTEGSQN